MVQSQKGRDISGSQESAGLRVLFSSNIDIGNRLFPSLAHRDTGSCYAANGSGGGNTDVNFGRCAYLPGLRSAHPRLPPPSDTSALLASHPCRHRGLRRTWRRDSSVRRCGPSPPPSGTSPRPRRDHRCWRRDGRVWWRADTSMESSPGSYVRPLACDQS